MAKTKRMALLADSKDSLFEIREGIEFLWEAKMQKKIEWGSVNICSIFEDPKGLDDILFGYTQAKVDVVVVVSKDNLAQIVLSILRNKYLNKATYIVPVISGQSNLKQVFKDIIFDNLPEIKETEFRKAQRLNAYELMDLFLKS
jgi:hypothetical protein